MGNVANRLLKGSSGNVWFNGELLTTVKSIEAKVKGEFSDHNFCGDRSTHTSYDGWSGEGTLTLGKIDSKIWKLVAKAYKDGVMPNLKIVTSLEDVNTGESERASIEGIVITEFSLAAFKAKEPVEEEYPFKFSDYDTLDSID